MVQVHEEPLAGQHTDDVAVEPAHVAWQRRLAGAPADTAAEFASAVAEVIANDLRADHVALWRLQDHEYRVLGSRGLSAGAQRMHLPDDYPVVNVARGLGGTLVRDDDNHLGPRAPGLPGSSSTAYAMLMLRAGPVALVTMSASQFGEGAVTEVQRLLGVLDWPPLVVPIISA